LRAAHRAATSSESSVVRNVWPNDWPNGAHRGAGRNRRQSGWIATSHDRTATCRVGGADCQQDAREIAYAAGARRAPTYPTAERLPAVADGRRWCVRARCRGPPGRHDAERPGWHPRPFGVLPRNPPSRPQPPSRGWGILTIAPEEFSRSLTAAVGTRCRRRRTRRPRR
jgi:hypothetical protein